MKGAFCDYLEGFGITGEGFKRNGNTNSKTKGFIHGNERYLQKRVCVGGKFIETFNL